MHTKLRSDKLLMSILAWMLAFLALESIPVQVSAGSPAVTFPAGPAVSFLKGNAYTVRWQGVSGDKVDVILWAAQPNDPDGTGLEFRAYLAQSTDNDGSQPWTVPAGLAAADRFLITVSNTGASSQAVSDWFSIKNPASPAETSSTRGIALTDLTVGASACIGSIHGPGEAAWYSFSVPRAGNYTIETWAGTLAGTNMELYGPDSMMALLEEDKKELAGHAAKIGPSALNPGRYDVKVTAQDSKKSGTFLIRVTCTPPMPQPGKLNAASSIVTLTANAAPVSGNIASGTDVDWFKFTVSSSGTYVIETFAGSLTDNYMYLYGPNSQASQLESDDDDGTGFMAMIGPRTLSAGTYYLKVRGYSSTRTGTYTIQVRKITSLTTNGSPVSGNISSGTDEDWFKITVSSPGLYTVETWAGSLTDNYMTLYGPNSQTSEIESDDDDGTGFMAMIGPRMLSTGTYYVKVRGYSSARTGSYTIQVRKSSVTSLTVNGSSASGNISSGTDVDWFKFTVSSSGTYTMETFAGSLTDNYMVLYGPNSLTSEIESDDDDGTGYMAKIGPRTLSAGTYYVKVRGYSSSKTGSYTIKVKSGGSTSSPVGSWDVSGEIDVDVEDDDYSSDDFDRRITVSSNGTFTDSEGCGGSWSMSGSRITLSYRDSDLDDMFDEIADMDVDINESYTHYLQFSATLSGSRLIDGDISGQGRVRAMGETVDVSVDGDWDASRR